MEWCVEHMSDRHRPTRPASISSSSSNGTMPINSMETNQLKLVPLANYNRIGDDFHIEFSIQTIRNTRTQHTYQPHSPIARCMSQHVPIDRFSQSLNKHAIERYDELFAVIHRASHRGLIGSVFPLWQRFFEYSSALIKVIRTFFYSRSLFYFLDSPVCALWFGIHSRWKMSEKLDAPYSNKPKFVVLCVLLARSACMVALARIMIVAFSPFDKLSRNLFAKRLRSVCFFFAAVVASLFVSFAALLCKDILAEQRQSTIQPMNE